MRFIPLVFLALSSVALATGKPEPHKPAPDNQQQSQSQKQTAISSADQQQSATATQTQSAASNQSQTASNAGNQQVSQYENKRQTASAYAPSIAPTTVCATSRAGGVSTAVVGITGGTSGIDLQCDIRETARLFGELGYQETAALIACTSNAAVRAFNGRACPLRTDTPDGVAKHEVAVTITQEPAPGYVTQSELVERDRRIVDKVSAK